MPDLAARSPHPGTTRKVTGYRYVAFDGVNRFYVSSEHAELEEAVAVPPNSTDGFLTPSDLSIHRLMNELAEASAECGRLREELGEQSVAGREMSRMRRVTQPFLRRMAKGSSARERGGTSPDQGARNLDLTQASWSGWTGMEEPPSAPTLTPLYPGAIRQQDVLTSDYAYWARQVGEQPSFHNKQWQYFAALKTWHAQFASSREAGRAMGFGVGVEPLPSYLASQGWNVLATDYFGGPQAAAWTTTNQMARHLEDLNGRGLCAPETFASRCELVSMDMNEIPRGHDGTVDFTWSLCALGHIGGYGKGLEFILRSADLLAPGGIAVHTTEMDFCGPSCHLDTPGLSLYRREDLERTLTHLRSKGFSVPEHDFSPGNGILESWVDSEPYSSPHLRLSVLGHIVVPVALVFSRDA